MYVWKKKVCIQLGFNGRSMYGAETSHWSIGGENARLIMSLLRRNINSKVDFREELSKVLKTKSRTVDRRKLRRTGKCSFISIFPLVFKLMTQIASMFSVKYVCRLAWSPKPAKRSQKQWIKFAAWWHHRGHQPICKYLHLYSQLMFVPRCTIHARS